MVEKLASEKMTTGCVLEAPKSSPVQLTEMSHYKSMCDLEMGVTIRVVKPTCFVSIYHLCPALLTKVFIGLLHKPCMQPRACWTWAVTASDKALAALNGFHLNAE